MTPSHSPSQKMDIHTSHGTKSHRWGHVLGLSTSGSCSCFLLLFFVHIFFFSSQILNVMYGLFIYLNLGSLGGKCRYIHQPHGASGHRNLSAPDSKCHLRKYDPSFSVDVVMGGLVADHPRSSSGPTSAQVNSCKFDKSILQAITSLSANNVSVYQPKCHTHLDFLWPAVLASIVEHVDSA